MQNQGSPYGFREGFRDGLPIGLGYLAVSFGFGILAVAAGLQIGETLLISMTNLTSAGQTAGVTVLKGALSTGQVTLAGLISMVLTQLVINLRYALMGVSLTQRLDGGMTGLKRLFYAMFITDEIYAVAYSKKNLVGARYFSGLAVAPYIGWALGTLLGAVAGHILPDAVTRALGVALYAMFIAIILPPMRTEKGVLACVLLSAGISCILTFVPWFHGLPEGFPVIISAVTAAAGMALMRPLGEEVQAA